MQLMTQGQILVKRLDNVSRLGILVATRQGYGSLPFGGTQNSTISGSQRSGTKCVSHSFLLEQPAASRAIVATSGDAFHTEVQGSSPILQLGSEEHRE